MRARMVEPRMTQAMAQPSQMKPMASSRLMAARTEQAAGQAQARGIARAVARRTRAPCQPPVNRRARRRSRRGASAASALMRRSRASDTRGSTSSTTQRARRRIDPHRAAGEAEVADAVARPARARRRARRRRAIPAEAPGRARQPRRRPDARTQSGGSRRGVDVERTPCHAATSACTMRETSRAVENSPACPATPPMARAFSSWTTPRSSPSVGAVCAGSRGREAGADTERRGDAAGESAVEPLAERVLDAWRRAG